MIFCSSCKQKVVIVDSMAACEKLQNEKAGVLVPQDNGYVVKCEDCLKKEGTDISKC